MVEPASFSGEHCQHRQRVLCYSRGTFPGVPFWIPVSKELISERLVVWCAQPQPEGQLPWMCSQSCRGTAGRALKEGMQAVGHESSFLLAESHLVHAGDQLEETQCTSLGSPPVRKYFSISSILACKSEAVLNSPPPTTS